MISYLKINLGVNLGINLKMNFKFNFWLLSLLYFLCLSQVQAASQFQINTLVQEKDVIWGFDFLSEVEIIYTLRSGKIKLYNLSTKTTQDIEGVPRVFSKGQGGLLDVRVGPKGKSQIFFTFSEPVEDHKAVTSLGVATLNREKLISEKHANGNHTNGKLTGGKLTGGKLTEGKFTGAKLTDYKRLFQGSHPTSETIHFGSRIEFDKDYKHIFVSIGDRNQRQQVQDLGTTTGKLIRLLMDGSIPKDNPFVQNKKARHEIWSYGHRSPQGLVRHPVSQDLWLAEMGPRGGDELNLILKGANYGWPEVTYGREYWGPKIGVTEKAGTEPPVVYWVPSISPSGMDFYRGDKFPQWKHQLFVGCLSGQHLRRIKIVDQKVVEQEELLTDQKWRIRQVRSGPDGFLYLSTDNGLIVRIQPQ